MKEQKDTTDWLCWTSGSRPYRQVSCQFPSSRTDLPCWAGRHIRRMWNTPDDRRTAGCIGWLRWVEFCRCSRYISSHIGYTSPTGTLQFFLISALLGLSCRTT